MVRISSTSPFKITLRDSQRNDATRILPPTSRLRANVVLSVVPKRSTTFSTMSTPETPTDASVALLQLTCACG
jgi:hypothetical protein